VTRVLAVCGGGRVGRRGGAIDVGECLAVAGDGFVAGALVDLSDHEGAEEDEE